MRGNPESQNRVRGPLWLHSWEGRLLPFPVFNDHFQGLSSEQRSGVVVLCRVVVRRRLAFENMSLVILVEMRKSTIVAKVERS